MTTDRDLRNPTLDALLRAHSDEMPPPHVDAAILAEAHRAVDRASHKAESTAGPRSWRWWIPLAAAATIGAVAIGVLQVAPTEPEIAPPVVSDSPAAPPRATAPVVRETPPTFAAPSPPIAGPSPPPQAATSAQATRHDGSLAAERIRSARRDELARAPEAFPTQKQPAPDSAAATAPATSRGEPAAAPAPTRIAPNRESTSPAGRSAKAASADNVAPRSVAEWIERMRALRNDGKPTEAEQALVQFRATYPDADARLPIDLREWAASITR